MPGLSQPEPRAQGSRRLLDAGKSAGGGYCSGCERSGWGGLGGGGMRVREIVAELSPQPLGRQQRMEAFGWDR